MLKLTMFQPYFLSNPSCNCQFPMWLSGKRLPAMQETQRYGFHPWVEKIPMEKEMATHSSILAWKILWTEEPGGL